MAKTGERIPVNLAASIIYEGARESATVGLFTDLRDYPLYNRVRRLFYPGEPPVSTVVEVSGMLPSREVIVEVEATAFIPRKT